VSFARLLNEMKEIDVKNWYRKTAFENFSTYTNPTFSVGTRLDVTELVEYCKKTGKSFFITFLFVLSKCANGIDEMRYRFFGGRAVEFEKINPSFVVLMDDGSIETCWVEYDADFKKFYSVCKEKIEKVKQTQEKSKFNSQDGVDCLYISCLPWIDLVTVSNPYNFSDLAQTSIPRITWGKYVKNLRGRYEMGFDVSAHHALIDGYHVANLMGKITTAIENLESFLKEGN
jgi:chloramphenicol O-acetyltransferase type A